MLPSVLRIIAKIEGDEAKHAEVIAREEQISNALMDATGWEYSTFCRVYSLALAMPLQAGIINRETRGRFSCKEIREIGGELMVLPWLECTETLFKGSKLNLADIMLGDDGGANENDE